MCNSKMIRIPAPSSSEGPFFSHNNPKIEVALLQFGCGKCETIHTYEMRKDGKQGDLDLSMKRRKAGHGRPVREDFGGALTEITG